MVATLMPSAALRLCSSPGCPQLVPKGRCAAHQTVHYRNEERRRGTAKQRGYDADWRKVREQALVRDKRLCVACLAGDYVTAASEVDHIVPLHRGGARLALANLMSLCHDCHAAKTARENQTRRRA
jgi:5-methylcytosine-specific restriction protein A